MDDGKRQRRYIDTAAPVTITSAPAPHTYTHQKKILKSFGAQAHEAHVIHFDLHQKRKKKKARQIIADKQALKMYELEASGKKGNKKNAQ